MKLTKINLDSLITMVINFENIYNSYNKCKEFVMAAANKNNMLTKESLQTGFHMLDRVNNDKIRMEAGL